MNKIILIGLSLAVAAVSLQASSYQDLCNDNSEKNLRTTFNHKVYKKNRYILDGSLNGADQSYASRQMHMINGRAHYESLGRVQKVCGVSTSFSFTTDSGQNLNIDSSKVAIALDQYVKYLYTKYDVNDGMLTKHYIFISRMENKAHLKGMDDLSNFDKLSINGAWLIDTVNLDKVVFGTQTIYNMTCKNNYNSNSIIGHMGSDIQEYLLMLVQNDFKAADALLNDLIPGDSFKSQMDDSCRTYEYLYQNKKYVNKL